ncbi:MAG: dihydroneopterin aldolase [Burkholderiales bacterium]|nr:dihydroneopterin aldolase [Burkholderiales bacterium]
MDIVFISELKIETRIGVYEWERHVPQTIRLDLEVGLPGDHASKSDRLNDTIDYAAVMSRIQAVLAGHHFGLLENLAEHIARLLIDDFGSPWVKVSVAKIGNFANTKLVGVTIERKR